MHHQRYDADNIISSVCICVVNPLHHHTPIYLPTYLPEQSQHLSWHTSDHSIRLSPYTSLLRSMYDDDDVCMYVCMYVCK